jgi:hypothetical protein
MYNVGVVGYSTGNFDTDRATQILRDLFNVIDSSYLGDKPVCVVSGASYVGIPALSYDLAVERVWLTKGIACKRVSEYEVFPCDSLG